MAFAGCWLFYRAFQIAVPDGDHYRYAKLIFLWPSLLYWPSSIGKDSWMLLTIAIAVARDGSAPHPGPRRLRADLPRPRSAARSCARTSPCWCSWPSASPSSSVAATPTASPAR